MTTLLPFFIFVMFWLLGAVTGFAYGRLSAPTCDHAKLLEDVRGIVLRGFARSWSMNECKSYICEQIHALAERTLREDEKPQKEKDDK